MINPPLIPVHAGIQIVKCGTAGVGLRIICLTQNSMIRTPVCTGVSGLGVLRWR